MTDFKLQPINWDDVADVTVDGNKFMNSNVLVFNTIGVALKDNFFEDLEIIVMNGKDIILEMCTLKNCTVYLQEQTENVTIVDNTIYVEAGREWLKTEESVKNVFVQNNIIMEIEGAHGDTGGEDAAGTESTNAGEHEPPLLIRMTPIVVIAAVAVMLISLKVVKGFIPRRLLG